MIPRADRECAPWCKLAAESLWRCARELPSVRPELRPIVQEHVERLCRVLNRERERRRRRARAA